MLVIRLGCFLSVNTALSLFIPILEYKYYCVGIIFEKAVRKECFPKAGGILKNCSLSKRDNILIKCVTLKRVMMPYGCLFLGYSKRICLLI